MLSVARFKWTYDFLEVVLGCRSWLCDILRRSSQVQKLLLDPQGLTPGRLLGPGVGLRLEPILIELRGLRNFVCQTPERFYAVAKVLAKMVEARAYLWMPHHSEEAHLSKR